jgi:hypothetical protein
MSNSEKKTKKQEVEEADLQEWKEWAEQWLDEDADSYHEQKESQNND